MLDGPAKFIDTSRNYGFGRSEQRVGAVVRERGGWPKGAILSTKLDRDAESGNRFDAAQVRRSLEASLKALGLDRVKSFISTIRNTPPTSPRSPARRAPSPSCSR